jgi:X-linked retinitis pigmentosa GTPase regulator
MEKFTEVFYWGSDTTGQFGVGDRSIGKTFSSPRCCSFSIPIRRMSCGDEHSGFIAANGYVYTMGSNKQGRLGINNATIKFVSRPVLIESLVDYQIVDLSCGASHSAAVSTSGAVFTWGSGSSGALGFSESDCAWQPSKVSLAADCLSVSCGCRHTAAVTEDSSLFVWGSGEAGQLGINNRAMQRYPVNAGLAGVQKVACGVFHTLVLLDTGEVLAAGGNSFGQLGLGTKESASVFVKIPALGNKDVAKIAAGQHSACVTSAGELFLWGTGTFGELMVPTRVACASKIVEVDVGIGFGAGIDRNGNVWTWGANSTGCLGTGDL